MTLQEYLGNKLYNDIRNQAVTECSDFVNQSGATKLALVDKIKIEHSIMKQGMQHLVNVLDDVAAENELLEKKNNYYLQAYGEIDKNYNYKDKNDLTVVRTSEKIHAKKAFAKYIQQYESENNNDSQKNVKPTENNRVSTK